MNNINKPFISDQFLLDSPLAEQLYFDFASPQPIIDYHSHLSPKILADNNHFSDMTELWLQGDHYKWRAMRAFGIEEKYITGDAEPRDKFKKWSEVVPYTVRNPLFHWTQMELKNPFGINELLNPESADRIYGETFDLLQNDNFKPLSLLNHFNVKMQGTTDDPIDSLEYHKTIKTKETDLKFLPSFRPDKVFSIHKKDAFREYINQLSAVSAIEISSFDSLMEALKQRIDFFDELGCVSSDHSFSSMPTKGQFSREEVDKILTNILNGDDSDAEKIQNSYTFLVLSELCKFYFEKNWVQQFHLGALRDANSSRVKTLGVDTGFDSIGDYTQAQQLSEFLSHLENQGKLSKTIIYNLNPSDNAVFGAMIGNFQGDGVKGKIQFGAAWWFLDQLDGMTDQINTLSNLGLLSTFVGMLTDSRSFVSYSRHDYFRRLLCNIFANDINKGLIPNDKNCIGSIIEGICYKNAKNYFNL